MDIRSLTPTYAVSPQIEPADLAALADAGFTTVVCNRPDGEVPPPLQAAAIRAAAEAAGLAFIDNPFNHTAFSMDLVSQQAEAINGSAGPVFAYCASGNRSSVLWSMAMVSAGELTPADAVTAAAQAGYDQRGLLPQLEMLAPKG